MDIHELQRLFEAVRRGEVSPDEASRRVKTAPLEETGGFATVDLHRAIRCGSPEVIFGQGKTVPQIVGILQSLIRHGHGGLVTRVEAGAGAELLLAFPEGEYNASGRTFRVRQGDPGPKLGKVVVVTAGTSDLPVAEEARVSAEAWNCDVTLVADVGVAGIHRLFNRLPDLQVADVLVVVA